MDCESWVRSGFVDGRFGVGVWLAWREVEKAESWMTRLSCLRAEQAGELAPSSQSGQSIGSGS